MHAKATYLDKSASSYSTEYKETTVYRKEETNKLLSHYAYWNVQMCIKTKQKQTRLCSITFICGCDGKSVLLGKKE